MTMKRSMIMLMVIMMLPLVSNAKKLKDYKATFLQLTMLTP